MLIDYKEIIKTLRLHRIRIKGILHVGAHDCQELPFYKNLLFVKKSSIIWIDAIESKVIIGNKNGNKVYHATITDKDDEDVTFNISNNEQSSSILDFKIHLIEHPEIEYVKTTIQKSITIDTFFSRNNLDPQNYNFWNLDIQGAELLALKGAINSIKHVKVIYIEINEKELYKDCALIDKVDIFLKEYGFNRIITKMTPHGWGDAIYIKI